MGLSIISYIKNVILFCVNYTKNVREKECHPLPNIYVVNWQNVYSKMKKSPVLFSNTGENSLAESRYVVLLLASADHHEFAVDGVFLGQQYVAVLFDVAVQRHRPCLQEIVALTVGGCGAA